MAGRNMVAVWRLPLILSFALVACAKPHNLNPYWARSDKLFLEFIDAPMNLAGSDEIAEKNVERLQRIRRDTALLDHPEWANRYHELLVELMQYRIGSLSASQSMTNAIKGLMDLASADPAHSKKALEGVDNLQKSQSALSKSEGEKTRKMLDELTTERRRIGGPRWPFPWLDRTPSK
jgi:hypothetical protein